jgi:hypothetical protein
MSIRKIVLVAAVLFLPALPLAAQQLKPFIKVQDKASFVKALKINGFTAKGGISKSQTDAQGAQNDQSGQSDDDGTGKNKSFPHFTSSFTFGGVKYPYTMVGYKPASGKTTNLKSVIIPLRMNFVFFERDVTFDPKIAVDNIRNSPMFNDAAFANGTGQFGDMLQRATFWNKMDKNHKWHVIMNKPRVLDTVDVLVEPDTGEIFQVGPGPNDLLGNLRFGLMDSTIHTILQFANVAPDEVPIFVTGNVFADALGYHDAFVVGQSDNTDILQTLIYTSWLDTNLVGTLIGDVSTLNHEMGEWLNDPYVNNIVPTWTYPPLNVLCSDNPFLEVGDPQGNGPQFDSFPTVAVPLNGYTYHLQDLVMVPWFAEEVPSSAQNGWYDFPDTRQITKPAVLCKP